MCANIMTTLLCTLLAGPSFQEEAADEPAQEASPQDEARHPFDADEDGRITLEELNQALSEQASALFERAEADPEEGMTYEQLRNQMPLLLSELYRSGGPALAFPGGPFPGGGFPLQAPAGETYFRTFDRNEDGRISLDELPEPLRERAAATFEELEIDPEVGATYEQMIEHMPRLFDRPFGGAAPGFGFPGPATPQDYLRRLDANEDGRVSLEELPEGMRERAAAIFEELQIDPEQGATYEELMEHMPRLITPPGFGAPPGAPFGFPGGGEGYLRRLDGNEDGRISLEELPEGVRERAAEVFEVDPQQGATYQELTPHLPRILGVAAVPPAGVPFRRLLDSLDQNEDGRLTLEEFPEPLRERAAALFEELELDPQEGATIDELRPHLGTLFSPPTPPPVTPPPAPEAESGENEGEDAAESEEAGADNEP